MRRPWTALLTMVSCAWAVAVAEQTPVPVSSMPSGSEEAEIGEAPPDPWAAIAPEWTRADDRPLQRRKNDSRAATRADGSAESGGNSGWRTVGALAGVVGLILLAGWGYRAAAGGGLGLASKNRRPGLIEIVSKTSLSAKQSLCLVRIGPRMVLIGQSPDTLRTLDVIADPDVVARLAGEAVRKSPGGCDAQFRACLEGEARRYPDEGEPELSAVTPEDRRIDEVRRTLSESIRRIRGSAS